ncbi:acyltransferase [Curtobacterium sp. MCBD17_035]|uniref:acyltransferase family protein n=1 Tax=Curtobacterium sp. MCBD17_035 TaxID=2175673 RepID=UPI000DA8ED59|nr:acyltransferase [Curtobacterium sp. MCBD17_035]WIB66775.1 acyltransferase [Curtobacterium sp. MCBD17_035]
MTTRTRTASTRDATLDIARGIAITMIVLGHVLRGLASAHLLDRHAVGYIDTDRLLYSVHLTVFAFISGLFVARAVDRDGVGRYLRSRDVLFIYVYVVWSLVQGVVKLAAGALVNSPTSITSTLDLLHPDGQLWFLPWLVAVSTVAALVRPWRSRAVMIASIVGALVVSIAGWGTDLGVALVQGLGIWVFFFLGVCIGARRVIEFIARVRLPVVGVVALVGTVAFVALVFGTSEGTPTPSAGDHHGVVAVALGLLTTLVGLVAVIAVSRLLAAVSWLTWVGAVGRRTLEIFLASITFASGTRIVLSHLGVQDPVVHVVVGTLAGVVGPILLGIVLERLRFPWLFTAPSRLTGTRASVTPRADVPAHR